MREKRRATPPPSKLLLLERTPRGFKEVIDYGDHVLNSIKAEKSLSPSLKILLERHVKGSTASAYSRELVELENKKAHEYQQLKNARQSLPGTVASKSGIITVDMVRASKRKREEDEVEKAQKALWKAQGTMKRKEEQAKKERNKPVLEAQKRRKAHLVEVRKVGKIVQKRIAQNRKNATVQKK